MIIKIIIAIIVGSFSGALSRILLEEYRRRKKK